MRATIWRHKKIQRATTYSLPWSTCIVMITLVQFSLYMYKQGQRILVCVRMKHCNCRHECDTNGTEYKFTTIYSPSCLQSPSHELHSLGFMMVVHVCALGPFCRYAVHLALNCRPFCLKCRCNGLKRYTYVVRRTVMLLSLPTIAAIIKCPHIKYGGTK